MAYGGVAVHEPLQRCTEAAALQCKVYLLTADTWTTIVNYLRG